MDTIDLSSKLIRFKSITPNSSGSLEFIKSMLEEQNFKCYLLEFGKDKIKNLYASLKGGDGPVICFAGHTDVVPPGDIKKWKTDPFKPVIKKGKLYGRGSSDMKTAIASFIVASLRFLKKNQSSFNGTLSFLITADEEGDAKYGTKSVIKWLTKNKKKIDYCLVGEPTNPEKLGEMIKIGRRGSINFVLDVFGIQGHVAYPEKAENPIDKVMKICNELKKPFDKGSRTFQPTKLVIT
ncbi:MAG: succinyl-diaminopimelate desuccinylase [Pseudomonadota bacterium]|nr:succinyl-diaminopimelate desuccinylase [Pseudomonadota bacterium]